MEKLEEFNTLTDAEEYFEFFGLDYDESLVNAKRFHILRKFGELIGKASQAGDIPADRLLDYYRLSLVTVYKQFENGYAPSAADVWNMMERQGGCISCSSIGSCGTGDASGQQQFNSCSSGGAMTFSDNDFTGQNDGNVSVSVG